MDPSGYCHRKLGRAQTLSLPRASAPSVRQYNCLPTSFSRARFCFRFARSSRLRTLKTAQVGFPSAVRPRQPPFFLSFFFLSQTFFQGFRFSFPAPRSALASPVHCSLLPSPSLQDQALDLLVSPSSIHYCTSTDDLSSLSSSRGLTCF